MDDKEILQGTAFNPLEGVSAVDDESNHDLTLDIVLSGDLNTSKVGIYELTYSVTNADGEKAEIKRIITVKQNPDIGKPIETPTYENKDGTRYNIAKGCVAQSNSEINDGAAASKACDGTLDGRWESAHGVDNVNFTVDLGAKLAFDEIRIFWEGAYATDYTLKYSDDKVSWKIIEKITDQKPEREELEGLETFVNIFANLEITARYVRIDCTKRATNYGYSIREFEVYGMEGTVFPSEEYPDLFDAQKDGSPDWRIKDEQELIFDLGGEKQVDFMRLAFKDYLAPASYKVYFAGEGGQFEELFFKNRPWSSDTYLFYHKVENREEELTLTARYFKVVLLERRFDVPSYRIIGAEFKLTAKDETPEVKYEIKNLTVTSQKEGHGYEFITDGNDATYWENANDNQFQTIDLGEVKAVGRVDLYWRGDDGGKGKYYDLLISSDGENWTTAFRQTHGATALQSVFLYRKVRYIRIKDYQSPDSLRFNLEGMVVHPCYPNENGIDYDTTLKLPELAIVQTENGSYITGEPNFPTARLIAYLDDSLRGKPVPSNDWWQGLLVKDKGYNMFMNPLTATFKTDGLWLTNPGSGYFDGFNPGNGSQTVNVDVQDVAIGYAGMGKDAEVRVTGYSDYGISAVMTDNKKVDKLTVYLAEGTLYAYCIFAEPDKALITAKDLIAVYDLDGKEILGTTGATFTGDCIVVMVRTHSGYETGISKYKDENGNTVVNDKIYEERYYVVSVPEGTQFIRNENIISVNMLNGNYMSVGAAATKNAVPESARSFAAFPKKEAVLLHEHGYAFVTDTFTQYSFDEVTNEVTTDFILRTVLMRNGFTNEAYSAFMPHHIAKSDYVGEYSYPTVHGDCVAFAGNKFTTKDVFYGLVPTFNEPTDDTYSSKLLYDQLLMLYKNNGGDDEPDLRLISSDPYWQGKNLHPMAMAALAADQLGATDLRDKFLDKIQYILEDWFTYDPVKDREKEAYFYYDSEWGTLYYKNSEFGAGVNLADHYFTFGYYTLAAGVLSAYRPEFAAKFGDMIMLLIRDYMNPNRNDPLFPYMRNFDMFSGHGWAGGYADNNGGNNQESAGEALNSWVGAYLYATAVGNEQVRLAAIYGYTTELAAIKHYWFNYFNDFPETYPYGVVGQVYGGSNFFGTFFNGEPLYMYGIHLIPGEEFLTGYGLDEHERKQLAKMLSIMRKEQDGWDLNDEKHKEIYAWQHIFIPITAIYDADEALKWYDEVLKNQGNVGNDSEQFNVYWLIHGMKSTGVRTRDIWAENGASATVYIKDGEYKALCWNPTLEEKKIVFRNADGVTGYAIVPAQGLVSCDPTKQTTSFVSYTDVDKFSVDGFAQSENATVNGGNIIFGENGSVSYPVAFGSNEGYYRFNVKTAAEDIRLEIDGKQVNLTKVGGGYRSDPITLSFKHTVTLSGSNATVAVDIQSVGLELLDVKMTATASSKENNDIGAEKAVDGDMGTRWGSAHTDDEWLIVEIEDITEIYQLQIHWEAASAKEYKVYFSLTGEDGDWTEVFHGEFSQGERTDKINPVGMNKTKYIKIQGISRTTPYGYSILELQLYNFNNQGA